MIQVVSRATETAKKALWHRIQYKAKKTEETMSEFTPQEQLFLVSALKSEGWIFSDYADLVSKGEISTHKDVISLLEIQIVVLQGIIDGLGMPKELDTWKER
jgi:hypothetical protein